MRAVSRTRRGVLERERHAGNSLPARFFAHPNLGWALAITSAFVVACSMLAIWARAQPLVAAGRVANESVVARVPFAVENPAATRSNQEETRRSTPRVYVASVPTLEAIGSSIENLPRTLSAVERLDQLAPEIGRQFKLTEASLAAIRAQSVNGEPSPAWIEMSHRLVDALKSVLLLDDQAVQLETQKPNKFVEMRVGDEPPRLVPQQQALVSIREPEKLTEAMTRAARQAGFGEPTLSVVVNRLTTNPEATFRADESATSEAQNAAVRRLRPVIDSVPLNTIIYTAGERITEKQLDHYKSELRAFEQTNAGPLTWVRWISVVGAVGAIGGAVAGYLALFCPRVRRNPMRMLGIAALLSGMLTLAVVATVMNPALIMLTAVVPTVFVAVILVIAYDQRVALALSTLHGVLVCIALAQPIGVYALMLTGISVAVIQLREIRERSTLVRMGLIAGIALALGTVLVALIDRPLTEPSLRQLLDDAMLTGFGGIGVGVVTLAILPAVERWFGIITGMTLIELRDPKQPLLRQLQQRAPGTYNHSLNVASIAEAAAESIKADSLLTYVGALYHDIGKMNKPEYFVENQAGAISKHDKLSPAMSLLVIVGHVKDGLAMAHEESLPRALRHFIEAHHGTTLVEFFYNRARQNAEKQAAAPGPEPEAPSEIEYRYPGPKPRTKEVAILMLADAVESATRSLPEPTPSRIETLVRAIANRRLMDGQFDECDLTLRELQAITESISRTVASIYHGRVLYPSTAELLGNPLRDSAETVVTNRGDRQTPPGSQERRA
jgi:putative nucleotidyltransferase with HDIG domain